MGKKTRTGTGGRRTILQLFPPRSGTVCEREDSLCSGSEDEQDGNGDEYSFPRDVTTEMRMPVKATEGLSLLGAYEDSDDEDDADSQPPIIRTQHQSADILANFMAEIDAITTQPGSEEPTGDRSAPAPTPPRPEPKAQHHASEMGTEPESSGADFQYDTHTSLAEVGGLEMGDWQEVWDDNTGCYYYWNTQTNEVAWQLPYYLAHQVQGLQQYADSSTVNGNGSTQSTGCYAEQHSTAISAPTLKTKEVMESVVALTSEEEERHGVAASLLGPLIPAEVKEAEEKWRKMLVGGLEERENSLEDSLPGSPAPPLNEPDTPTHPLRDQRSRNQSEEDSDAEETEEDTMELELALDRKKAELRALEEGDCSAGGSSPCSEASQEAAGPCSLLPIKAKWKTAFLRAASPDTNSRGSDTLEDPDTAHSKVPEKAGEEEDQETGDKTATKVTPKEEVETPELKFQIGELANTLTSKMEFLGINKKTISNFQLLLLQTETRIADWREGALNGIYLRRRLQEAAEHIKHYELNAAPKGWSCHWDREQRRYFYTNDHTSASQWDFPAEEEEEEEGAKTKASIQGEPKPPPIPTGGLLFAGASVFTPIVPPQPGLPSYWSVPQPPLPPDQPPPPPDSPPPPPPPPESPPPLPPPPLEDDGEIQEVEMEDDDDSEPPAPGTEPPLPPGVVSVKVVESTASLGKSQKRKASGAGQLTKAVTIGSSAILYTQTTATAAPLMSGAAYWGVSAIATPPLPSEPVAPPLPPPPTRPPLPPTQAPCALDPKGLKTLPIDKTKKLKKDKSKKSKTKMPSLVKKWQSIQKALDEEEQASSSDEDRDQLNKRGIEEWKQQQLLTGKAGKNANFEALPDDWRERLLKKRKMMKST